MARGDGSAQIPPADTPLAAPASSGVLWLLPSCRIFHVTPMQQGAGMSTGRYGKRRSTRHCRSTSSIVHRR